MTQVIVPSKFFRESVKQLYIDALKRAGVTAKNITVHIDSSATLNLKAEDYDAVLTVHGLDELSDLSKLGNLKVVIPEAIEFLRQHNPTEGTTKSKSAANPMTEERKREMEARRSRRENLRRMLAEMHGIGDDDSDEL